MIRRCGHQDNKEFLSRNSTLKRRKEVPAQRGSFPSVPFLSQGGKDVSMLVVWEKKVEGKRRWIINVGLF